MDVMDTIIEMIIGLLIVLNLTNPVLTAITGIDLSNVGGTDLSWAPPLVVALIYLLMVYGYYKKFKEGS
jgi:hypothetical protein